MNASQTDEILARRPHLGETSTQLQTLEFAVRKYFKNQGFEVVFFYRAPRAAKVTFRYADNAFWTVEVVMPDDLNFPSDEDRDDWLYGSLIKNELPKIQHILQTDVTQF